MRTRIIKIDANERKIGLTTRDVEPLTEEERAQHAGHSDPHGEHPPEHSTEQHEAQEQPEQQEEQEEPAGTPEPNPQQS
jgi:hypothetical protein